MDTLSDDRMLELGWNVSRAEANRNIAKAQRDKDLALLPDVRREELERILDYLAYWWRSHTENKVTGESRHTFALSGDWKRAITKGKPPYKPEDWQEALKEE